MESRDGGVPGVLWSIKRNQCLEHCVVEFLGSVFVFADCPDKAKFAVKFSSSAHVIVRKQTWFASISWC